MIAVEDQGIGIAESKQKSLFIRFENLVDKNLFNQASTGIGLSLVKELIDMPVSYTHLTLPTKRIV